MNMIMAAAAAALICIYDLYVLEESDSESEATDTDSEATDTDSEATNTDSEATDTDSESTGRKTSDQ